jgi:hypothetical protein
MGLQEMRGFGGIESVLDHERRSGGQRGQRARSAEGATERQHEQDARTRFDETEGPGDIRGVSHQ